MSLFKKLYLLVKFNKTAKVVVEESEKVKESAKKNKFISTEFLMTLLASLGSILAASNGLIPPLYAASVSSLSVAFFSLSRGLVKKGTEEGKEKSGLYTREFWLGFLNDLGALLASISGIISPESATILITISRIFYSISRGVSKQE